MELTAALIAKLSAERRWDAGAGSGSHGSGGTDTSTMGNGQTILIVDDDAHLREVVRFALERAGYHTVEAADGRAALARVAERPPDLMVLDILMPELDGTEVCRQVRASSRIPIVFLSSRDDEVDRILGLELGGDDYVTKPFSPRELVARVRAVLRRVPPPPNAGSAPDARSGSDAQPGSDAVAAVAGASGPSGACVRAILTHGRLSLDPDRFVARWGDTEVVLTATEFAVVQALLGYPEKVFRRDELMERAYGADTVVSDRTIDSHVRRVRKKFADAGGAVIETVHGVGYRLGPCR